MPEIADATPAALQEVPTKDSNPQPPPSTRCSSTATSSSDRLTSATLSGPRRNLSRLVESVFLNLPIPRLYFNEEADGRWSVVDGQQRLLALFAFLENDHTLRGLTIYKDLNGKKYNGLTKSRQRFFRNYILSVVIIKKDAPPQVQLTSLNA